MESWSFGFFYVLTSVHVAEEMAFPSDLGSKQLLKRLFYRIFSIPDGSFFFSDDQNCLELFEEALLSFHRSAKEKSVAAAGKLTAGVACFWVLVFGK